MPAQIASTVKGAILDLDQSFRLGALGRNGVTMIAGSSLFDMVRLDFLDGYIDC